MKKRSTECETVFGQIKANQKFRRFHLRGSKKLEQNGVFDAWL